MSDPGLLGESHDLGDDRQRHRPCLPALLRQFEAGGPVFTARAAQSADTRNFDGQMPIRRAATALAQQMVGLGIHRPDTFTYAHLREAVDRVATVQTVIDDPAPLLQATQEILALADVMRRTRSRSRSGLSAKYGTASTS